MGDTTTDAQIDAKRLSFDARTVYTIVAIVVGVLLGSIGMMANVQSEVGKVAADLRVLLARQEGQAEVEKAKAELNNLRQMNLEQKVDALQRLVELSRAENARTREMVLGSQDK